jgi:hypothetical protein
MRRSGLPTMLSKRALKNFGPNKVALGQCAWNHRTYPDLSHVIFSEVSRRPCLSLRPSASERSPHLPQLSLLRTACARRPGSPESPLATHAPIEHERRQGDAGNRLAPVLRKLCSSTASCALFELLPA